MFYISSSVSPSIANVDQFKIGFAALEVLAYITDELWARLVCWPQLNLIC